MKQETLEQVKFQRDIAKSAVETWKQATANALQDRDELLSALQSLVKGCHSAGHSDGITWALAQAEAAIAKMQENGTTI